MRSRDREIKIRLARGDELLPAGDMAARAFSQLRVHLPPENWDSLEKAIRFTTAEDTIGSLLIAERAGEIVGSVRYTGPGHGGHVIYPDRFAYIRAVAVAPDHQRCGIGQKLTKACIELAVRNRATALGLHVATKNEAARNLYKRLGFEFYRKAPDYFSIAYEAYLLRIDPEAALQQLDM